MQKSVIDQLKRKQIAALLEQDKRIDGRGLEEQRKLVLETGVIPKANGSARVLLGNTHVVAGVKIQPDRPFPDTGDRGVFICTAEILPIAHHTAEPGPPNETVIELARIEVYLGITPVSRTSLRCSSRPRPSIRLSCSNNAAICLRFN